MPLMLEGKVLAYDVPFTTADGTQYPAGWLRSVSLAQKQSIGITEIAAPASYDQKFYWSASNPKALEDTNNYASYDSEGKGVGEVTSVTAGLKTNWIAKQKATAASLLAQTDWLVVRASETSEAVPSNTLSYRGSIRTISGEREAQITACSTVEELVALLNNPETMQQSTYQLEQVDKVDAGGNPVLDSDGNPVKENKLFNKVDADGNPVLDSDGNQVKETRFALDADGNKIVTGTETVANTEPFIKRWPTAPA